MGNLITINPLTRVNGMMEIQVEVEKNIIINAKCGGLLFRGFEKMLRGRPPLDAIYFTERICGICSSAHALASSYALEDILKVKPNENDKMVRDFIHASDIVQNHIRQFYQFTFPDFISGPKIQPLYGVDESNYRLPEALNNSLADHYVESFQYSRLAHEMLAVFGGKAPHNHGIFVGGVTVNIEASKFIKVKSILTKINEFVTSKMLPDAHIIADYYPEYFENGISYNNMMTYGLFDSYKEPELFYVSPQIMINGELQDFDSNKITENIHGSWFEADQLEQRPTDTTIDENVLKESGYSWIKAPRYDGLPMEVGPLARMWFNGEYRRGFSTMDRILARVLELKKIIDIMEGILKRIQMQNTEQGVYQFVGELNGKGLTDTSRGALGHWVAVNNLQIQNYEIVTPSAWNLSSEDSRGIKGVLEKSLIGTVIQNVENPVEIGIIARSFDPCISCATHVTSDKYSPITIRVV